MPPATSHRQDAVEFRLPEAYVQYVEPPLDADPGVEYDMDEQDRAWLDICNRWRRSLGQPNVTPDQFEFVIDMLEKEWHALTKDIVREETDVPAEDAACAICEEADCDNSNAIVYCDGCNLAVHQDCYGVPYIPEGQWLCRRCMLAPGTVPACVFCPDRTRKMAFKRTANGKWVHLLCALWIPEVQIDNPVFMEPIQYTQLVPKSRWSLNCKVCRVRRGACIQCAHENCYAAFHVTCAKHAKLYMQMRPPPGSSDEAYPRAFCDRHAPPEHQAKLAALAKAAAEELVEKARKMSAILEKGKLVASAKEATEREGHDTDMTLTEENVHVRPIHEVRHDDRQSLALPTSITATSTESQPLLSAHDMSQPSVNTDTPLSPTTAAYKTKMYRRVIMTPVVTRYMADLVTSRCNLAWPSGVPKKRADFLRRVFRYWVLKRANRPAAPLVKRLQLDPWTTGPEPDPNAEKEREKEEAEQQLRLERMQLVRALRNDFEKLRMLINQVVNREKQKLKAHEVVEEWMKVVLNPSKKMLEVFLKALEK